MSENYCYCTRPISDTATICETCSVSLVADLGTLADLVGDVGLARTRQVRFGTVVGSTRGNEKPVPFNEKASELLRELEVAALGWAVRWNLEGDRVSRVLRSLAEAVPRVRLSDEAPALVDSVAALLEAVQKVIDRPVEKKFVGRCSVEGCGADLMCWPGAGEVGCLRCSALYDVAALHAAWLDAMLDVLLNSADVSRVLRDTGHSCSAEQIRRWAKQGRLVSKGQDARGSDLYSPADVLFVIQAADYKHVPRQKAS